MSGGRPMSAMRKRTATMRQSVNRISESARSDVSRGDKGGVMKRNNLIAIAVGAIMGAALSSAYADQQLAPSSDNQPANQQATTVNPSPLGASAGSGGQQPAGQTNGQAGANGQGGQADMNADRRDIARDDRDIAHDQADIRNDRRDIHNDVRDIRSDRADLRHEYAEQRAGEDEQADIDRDRADIRNDRRDVHRDRADIRSDVRDIRSDRADLRADKSDLARDEALEHGSTANPPVARGGRPGSGAPVTQ